MDVSPQPDERTRFFSVREAARIVRYSEDYITRIARAGKIASKKVGTRRIVDIDDLKRFQLDMAASKRREQEQLRRERMAEVRDRNALLRGVHQADFAPVGSGAAFAAALIVFLGLSGGAAAMFQYITEAGKRPTLESFAALILPGLSEGFTDALEDRGSAAALIEGFLGTRE